MMMFDLRYMLLMIPAVLLAMGAQMLVKSTYARARQIPAGMSGYRAARRILDASNLHDVEIEEVPGELSDHYDPGARVLRLSPEVFHGDSMASVGIAAHEAGHALQHAWNYAPLTIRNLAVPVANFGSGMGMIVLMLGMMLHPSLILVGIVMFSGVVFFQLINLPVEFNASSRAKDLLVSLGIVHPSEMTHVNRVLNAAALTYVAATLQTVMQLLYYVWVYTSRRSDD